MSQYTSMWTTEDEARPPKPVEICASTTSPSFHTKKRTHWMRQQSAYLRKYSLYFIGPVLYQMTDLTPLFPKFSLPTEASMTLSPFFSRRL